ncbi:ShlB/FhaC/HecB family hemolysin secretion/activation protein [Aureibaculum sp. 2210JD6-5]|uniref:ShlB/FhaC/HecB family hemolysin secretion/activation protein n=1 Tax=Aureibaculum sp. 2210JD6-5 TaxID=3103957 RepID=UPI002AAE6BFE|nr:ShlB/FhaC/HecB family hemolysin secretion/activation protein [Aureibaculum sp. 2210JD6-5]MDY7394404.1 ShlB/FhaC/HecB family hemolysin secretion/activation protein [Aureibaculum sp. 2210JD6-5]
MKQKFTPYIYILIILGFLNTCYAQKLVLEISASDTTSTLLLQEVHYQKIHFSENSLIKSLDSVKLKIETMGFVNYNLDSLVKRPSSILQKKRPPLIPPKEGDTIGVSFPLSPNQKKGDGLVVNDTIYTAYFNLGEQIEKIKVYYFEKDISQKQLANIRGIVTSDYFEVNTENLSTTLQNIANTLEEQGNSFSQITLKNISIKNDSLILAELFVDKSTLRKIDKIIINGYTSFPKTFLKHHLKLEQNALFSKEKLDEASSTINAISFVSEIKPPEVLFTKDSTVVYLYLKKENANHFDGLIGFTSNETGKGLSLNGYLDLSLNNLFNSGENFNLRWKNNGNNRQMFDLNVALPFVFKSKISPELALNIYKQDSSFVNTTFKLALPYYINGRSSVGLILKTESSSNLLTINNNNIEDYKSTFYGLNYNYKIPNSHPLFRTKFNILLEALAGKRNGIVNSNQTKLYLKSNFLWNLNFKNHIFLQSQSGVINSEKLFSNELLRIGGTNSIRGFDEESILASAYSNFNIEYRYSTNNTSYLYSVTDLGYINNKISRLSSQLYAFGLGYAFSSKLGFINLSYALGGSPSQTLNFNNSRFHLKIVNFF